MKTVAVSDLCEVNPKHPEGIVDDERVAFVGMAQLDDVTATASDEEQRPFSEVSKGFTPFMNGDVLLAKITPCFENCKIGQAKTSTQVAAGSTEFHVLRAGPQLNDRYLLHFLRQPWIRKLGELRMTGSGGQRRVPERFMDELEIPLPSLEEQKRIAAILDAADNLRTKRRQALTKLDTLTQAIFHDMFGDPRGNPRGWEVRQLGTLVDLSWGNTSITKAAYVNDGVPAYSASGRDGYLPAAEHDGEGIVLSAIGARCGRCFYVEGGPWTAIKNTITITPRGDSPISVRFLHHLANMDDFWPSRGGAQPFIGLGAARDTLAISPPLKLQALFEERVSSITALQTLMRGHQSEIEDLFASLQQRAFRGEL